MNGLCPGLRCHVNCYPIICTDVWRVGRPSTSVTQEVSVRPAPIAIDHEVGAFKLVR